MWCQVMTKVGWPIVNAVFNYPAYNHGNGWYWVEAPGNTNICASGPGYYQVCLSSGNLNPSVYFLYYKLQAIPAPPKTSGSWSCWTA